MPYPRNTVEKIRDRCVELPWSGCWVWMGLVCSEGYARFKLNCKGQNGHRAMYVALRGPIAKDLTVDHLCRVRCCVNPAHMELVTIQENCHRQERKTHRKHGHAFTDDNTFLDTNGCRNCRTCRLNRLRRWRLKRLTTPAPTTGDETHG